MYNIANRGEVIREIKTYLYYISTTTRDNIGRTTIDEIYDNTTADIIRSFQKELGIEETGVVDYITFKYLSEEYIEILKSKELRSTIVEPSGLPLSRGMSNDDVRILNILISSLKNIYKDLPYVSGSYFSKNTERAIQMLREIFMLEDSKEVDAVLFDRMIVELDTEERKRKTNELKG